MTAGSTKLNLWALVDIGSDVAAVRGAINAMPSCLNVCGWSYVKGKRRGLARQQDGMWVVSDDVQSKPGTVLHYAVATGCVATTSLVVQMGAQASARLGDDDANCPSALEIAQANAAAWRAREVCSAEQRESAEAIASLLEAAERRQLDVLGGLEDDERVERRILELRESSAMSSFARALEDGVTPLTIVLKDGSGSSSTTTITVPRYISHKTLHGLIEQAVGQRVLVSFQTPLDPSVEFSQTMSSTNMGGTIGRRSIMSSSPSLSRSKPQTRTVELRPSTVATLLHLEKPCCVARPLVTGLVLPPLTSSLGVDATDGGGHMDSSKASSPAAADGDQLTCLMRELKTLTSSPTAAHNSSSSSNSNQQRAGELIAQIKVLLEKEAEAQEALRDLDATSTTFGSSRRSPSRLKKKKAAVLSQEEIDAAINRLYTQALTKVVQQRTELVDFIGEGARRLENRPNVAGRSITPEMEESIDRLFNQSVAKKAEKIAAIAEAVWAAVPKPVPAEITSEDAELARQRLTNLDHRREVLDEARSKYYGPTDAQKQHKNKLDKEQVQAHLESVYSGAISKRQAKLEALQAEYGDFQKRKKPCKKITLDEAKALADKLSKK